MRKRSLATVVIGASVLSTPAIADDVRGIAVLPWGAPLQYAKLTFCSTQAPPNCFTTVTGADGRFFLVIPQGAYSLEGQSYQGTNFKQQIQITGNAGELRIVMSQ